MTYLKLVPNEFHNASHDKRELSVAKELGYSVLVVATTKQSRNFEEVYDGYDVYRISTRRLGHAGGLCILNRIIAYLNFIITTIQIDADIISGHDYVATLAGYIANCFKRRKAKLIYDSHEFELHTYAPTHNAFLRVFLKIVEGFLLQHVDLTLVVGDKIADGVQEIYHLEKRPTVVRNIPHRWELNLEKSAEIRQGLLDELRISGGFLLMYHGGVMPGRGIEWALRSLALLPEDVGMIIMGQETTPGTISHLKEMARRLSVERRVLFHEAVATNKIKDYVGAVDSELVLIEGRYCRSHEYSLPNKFFESIQSCTPFICTNLPEMGAIVRQYGIGLLVPEGDDRAVADALFRLREDKELYARLKQNMEKAKEELCWEKESLKLKTAIQRMMGEKDNAM